MNNTVGILAVLLAAFSALQVEANYRHLDDYDGAALLPPHPRCSSQEDPIAAVAGVAAGLLEPFTSTFMPHGHVKGQYSPIQLLPFPVAPLNIARPFTQLQQTLSHPPLFGPLFSPF
ncbi:uncharacterized protein LOC132942400 [Metopolophium dirhodum]|uniref:uncharacterized protein LOC132942400 n=1 Tax=Metopolophium dirhodum TaxID=44670 RepID=UPI00298F68B8|nr:uncharacterized protein LOC132942400 [Metopolophium dirhodum]